MKQHHFDPHTLAAAYALHALEPAEREEFARHLPHCADCRREVAEFEATATRLASAVAQNPPTGLKQRTMAAIDDVRQLPPRTATSGATAGFAHRLRRRALPLALAACIAAAAVFAGLAVKQHRENDEARQQAQQAEEQLDAVSSVLAAPDARAAHGRASNGALTTVVSSDRQNQAVFSATGLPAPPRGHTYQLWLDQEGTMEPAGFIDEDGTVVIDGDVSGATAVGLTVEPAGGSARPTTQPLLLLALPS
ncbi:anti-sigma factor domain-containing protein [Streptomyces sp. NPDC058872]|uniref:anti-sigma factor n=1 Tax=Streptomyces sp. NPDC058872 TaxID=3346661 RepID=UPI00367E848A